MSRQQRGVDGPKEDGRAASLVDLFSAMATAFSRRRIRIMATCKNLARPLDIVADQFSKNGRGVRPLAVVCVFAAGIAILTSTVSAQAVILNGGQNVQRNGMRRVYPNQAYYNGFTAVAEGDFVNAIKMFQNAGRNALRTPQGRWIDSICYFAMLGESYYQLGENKQALKYYDDALRLYLRNQDWMRLVEFPNGVQADRNGAARQVTWGTGQRASVLGQFDNNLKLLRGRLDNDRVLEQGGVVQLPEFVLVNVHEIVRCTALALRRRMEILGPICRHDPLTSALVNAFEGRIGRPNHWSQAWVNVQLGLALAGAERLDEATRNLNASVVIAGRFDHPLTATALIELGKLAIRRGDNQEAVRQLVDASVIAGKLEQPLELEESLRLAGIAHVLTGARQPLPALAGALPWINRQRTLGRFVQSSCFMTIADSLLHLENPDDAAKALSKAKQSIRRRAALNERLKARFRFLESQLAAQTGKRDTSRVTLTDALQSQRKTSIRLFQTAIVDRGYTDGVFSDRVAALLFERLLDDPTDIEWQNAPLETLTILTTNQRDSYENWFRAVLGRNDLQKAIEIADRMRRHEFYSSLSMGGRLLSLRWMVDGPDTLLGSDARLQRQDLLTRASRLAEMKSKLGPLREQLAQLPIDAQDKQYIEATDLGKQILGLSAKMENELRMIALKRESSPLLFPPLAKTETIQAKLGENELLLIFVRAGDELHAFMLSADKYASWQSETPAKIKKTLIQLNKAIGNQDANASVNADQFGKIDWRPIAEQLRDQLFIDPRKPADRQQFGFWNRFDKLVVVPDDVVWHVPFELLLVPDKSAPDGGTTSRIPLIERTRIRTVPLASLSIPDQRPKPRSNIFPVLVGELFPRSGSLTSDFFLEWQQTLSNLKPLPDKPPVPSGVGRTVWDRLVVLNDLDNRKEASATTPYGWSPTGASAKPVDTDEMTQWMRLPWGGPEEILLPGFHTAAEDAFEKPDNGRSLFLASTALMATGAKTALLSRWRTGGETSFSLIREYLQERGDLAPTQAWQRAVHVVRPFPIDPDLEPRINGSKNGDGELTAANPFFWAGYVLLDRSAQDEKNQEQEKTEAGDAVEP